MRPSNEQGRVELAHFNTGIIISLLLMDPCGNFHFARQKYVKFNWRP